MPCARIGVLGSLTNRFSGKAGYLVLRNKLRIRIKDVTGKWGEVCIFLGKGLYFETACLWNVKRVKSERASRT